MKPTLIILLFLISLKGFSQDSTKMISAQQEKVIALQNVIDANEKEKAALKASQAEVIPCLDCMPELGWMWVYVLMPVLLSLLAAIYFIKWLKKEGYKISNALSDDVPELRLEEVQTAQIDMAKSRANIVDLNALNPANPQAVPVPVVVDTITLPMNRSSSRLIAFLSSMSASVLAICLFSYYMYFAIKGMPIPEFEDLWTILAALGLGIVPYATKVINEKPNK
ncbi:hypothetical protein [Algoriphagus antarcticus]|uniref:Uncharacterized protein n=1 Tax=Algoriphagus antarcticus TaxID=238540 RepID=A0A3E0D8G1_9BACT|nr:hypothetical protein [Algoriphagus antarcticus]REG78231.1 hypothetical protein C8N25_13925 [Algoriphagus antarcticus]